MNPTIPDRRIRVRRSQPPAFVDEPETRAVLQFLSQNAALVVADVGATALFLIAGIASAPGGGATIEVVLP